MQGSGIDTSSQAEPSWEEISACIALIEEKFPEQWRSIIANEQKSDSWRRAVPAVDYEAYEEEYRDTWHPIRIFLHKRNPTLSSLELTYFIFEIRKELWRLLGIKVPGS